LNTYARDNDESIRTMSRWRHSSVIKNLRNGLQIILVFFLPKENKVEHVKQRTRKKSWQMVHFNCFKQQGKKGCNIF
jgi:CRISPR/Cas system CMR-associated protein Cmr5 small subunit